MIHHGQREALPEPSFKSSWYKPSWTSVAVLARPLVRSGVLHRGALVLNQVDPLVERFPLLRQLFFLIERRGWCGVNESGYADIKLVEDLSTWEETRQRFPQAILLDIGPADFIDHTVFCPLLTPPKYDVLQIACWSSRKRLELMIGAAAQLPHVSFLHLGHFENSGTEEELGYRRHCLDLIRRTGGNVTVPFPEQPDNALFPREKDEMNRWINKARIGLLTTEVEGINRFKMESLSANRPMLVAKDACAPTRKHVNAETGLLFDPTPEALAAAIVRMLDNVKQFDPRGYLIRNTGRVRSLAKLKEALATLCAKTGDRFHFDAIDWDGRNQSLVWGAKGLRLLEELVREFSPVAAEPAADPRLVAVQA